MGRILFCREEWGGGGRGRKLCGSGNIGRLGWDEEEGDLRIEGDVGKGWDGKSFNLVGGKQHLNLSQQEVII
jgi:hypothetical protein